MRSSTTQESPSAPVGHWIAAARGGSDVALGRLMELCRQYLLLVANQELDVDLRAKGGASDLVQETFLEAHRDFRQFHGSTHGEVLAWLRSILRNNLSNFRRQYAGTRMRQIQREFSLNGLDSRSRLEGTLAASSASPSARIAGDEQSAALDCAIVRLPLDYQEVILLRHEQGLSFSEIARLMDRSPEAARKLWTRAVCQLRKELEGL